MTKIVTDGAADLPGELAEFLGIGVVRGPVRLDGSEWTGGPEAFWTAIDGGGALPATIAPSIEQLAEAFTSPEAVMALHVSAELSRTCANARAAAERVGNRVEVVDSRSVSVGTGLLAVAAAEAARTGVDLDKLGEIVSTWVDQLHVHAVIDDANFLVHGGRAGLVAAKASRHARRHVLAVKGHAIPICQVRHRGEAIRQLLDHLAEHVGGGVSRWAVGHGAATDVEDFVNRVSSIFGGGPSYTILLGAPTGSHLGPRSLVVGFFADG